MNRVATFVPAQNALLTWPTPSLSRSSSTLRRWCRLRRGCRAGRCRRISTSATHSEASSRSSPPPPTGQCSSGRIWTLGTQAYRIVLTTATSCQLLLLKGPLFERCLWLVGVESTLHQFRVSDVFDIKAHIQYNKLDNWNLLCTI